MSIVGIKYFQTCQWSKNRLQKPERRKPRRGFSPSGRKIPSESDVDSDELENDLPYKELIQNCKKLN